MGPTFILVPRTSRRDSVPGGDWSIVCNKGLDKHVSCLTAVKQEKFVKNKKNTSKERLSILLFRVLFMYFTSKLLIDLLTFLNFT